MKARSKPGNERSRAALTVAAAVRDACVEAALEAYETARMDGLCHEGAWEIAVGAMRSLNLQRVVDGLEREERS